MNAADLTPLSPDRVSIDSGSELTLVENGEAKLPIVYEDDERGGFAAAYLRSVIEKTSGVEAEVFRLPAGTSNAFAKCVFIPRPDHGDAFAVEVSGRGVRFSGRSDFAAYDFCERALGSRHYWDGDGGISVVKRDRVTVPYLRYSDEPVFSFRRYSARGNPPWLRVAKAGGTFDRWTRCHTTDGGFCYGSPEGFTEYCRRVDAAIAGKEKSRIVDRARKVVSVSPWDVAYDCDCRWCRTLKRHLGTSLGEASTLLWERFLPRLVAYLAEHHPDYRVSVLPYWNYVDAPENGTALGTNVQAEVCSMSGLALFKRERTRDLEEGIILDWERATGRKVANWHYSCWPAEYTSAAYVYGRTIAAHYRRMREHVTGSFICGGKDDFPRFSLSMYVWMRCLWNPDIDIDAVYDEFCRRQFGPAADPMRELIALQEDEWDPETLNFPPSALRRIAALLTESAALVRDTPYAASFIRYATGFRAH